MLEEWKPVKLCWYWQVQSLTKLAHMRKQDSQCNVFSIKCYGATPSNFPESSCSYLATSLSVKELNCL